LRFIAFSSVPEIKANPTPKNCLPLSRSEKVTQMYGPAVRSKKILTSWW